MTRMTHDVHFGGGKLGQKWDIIGRRGSPSDCSGRPIFIFVIKENWICPITRHDAIYIIVNNILLTKNLQRNHALMIPLPCLWAKSNNRTRGQCGCGFVLFLFWFHSFMCTVQVLFHSLFTFSSCANKTNWLENEY